jgi:hypothetical protein
LCQLEIMDELLPFYRAEIETLTTIIEPSTVSTLPIVHTLYIHGIFTPKHFQFDAYTLSEAPFSSPV